MNSGGSKGWLLQRISGALLFLMLGTHFYLYHYFMGPADWGFQSIGYGATDLEALKALALADPSRSTYYALAGLFANPVWKAFDIILITLGTYHGFYGIHSIIDDWMTHNTRRNLSNWLVYIIGFVLWVIGIVSVISFNPQLV